MKTEKEIRIYFIFIYVGSQLFILSLHNQKIQRFPVLRSTVLCTAPYCTMVVPVISPYLPTLNHLKNRGSRGYLPTKNLCLPSTSTPWRQRSEDLDRCLLLLDLPSVRQGSSRFKLGQIPSSTLEGLLKKKKKHFRDNFVFSFLSKMLHEGIGESGQSVFFISSYSCGLFDC